MVRQAGPTGFTKATVNRYRAALLEQGQSAAGVDRVPGVSRRGVRTGNWLI